MVRGCVCVCKGGAGGGGVLIQTSEQPVITARSQYTSRVGFSAVICSVVVVLCVSFVSCSDCALGGVCV